MTALGGDNRTGVAALVTLAATLLEHKLPYPPLTLLFTGVAKRAGCMGCAISTRRTSGASPWASTLTAAAPAI